MRRGEPLAVSVVVYRLLADAVVAPRSAEP